MEKYLLIIATLDTKGREAAYVKKCAQSRGIYPLLMDIGTLGEPLKEERFSQDVCLKKENSMEYLGWEAEQVQRS